MTERPTIVCPSYRRAGITTSQNVFGEELVFAVNESQVEEYQGEYPKNRIMAVSEDCRGNMAKVRNFIRDNVESDRFVMVDDDVEWLGYVENTKSRRMSSARMWEVLEMGFQMAEDLGTVLWGINLTEDRRFYRQYSPFSLLSPVLGPFSCHRGRDPDLRYDDRLGLNEDYDFALQVLKKYRKILRFNKYHYFAGHLDNTGGCPSYRTMDEEKRQAQIMIKKWGTRVVRYNFARSINPKVRVPYKGI